MRNVYVLAIAQALSAAGMMTVFLLGGILGSQFAPLPQLATLPVSLTVVGLAATAIPAALLMERIGRRTAFVINPSGDLIATYRKIHMFDVELAGGESYRESATVASGDEIVVTEIDGIVVGLATCYDLRFPELFRILALRGAEAIVLPAAFTMTTGKDHWETLIRARAIENQIYMIASAQWGLHPPGAWCYGRSMIVDPWGTVIATAADGVGVATAIIQPSRVEAVRRQVPSLANRRPEAYRWPEEAASFAAGRLAV